MKLRSSLFLAVALNMAAGCAKKDEAPKAAATPPAPAAAAAAAPAEAQGARTITIESNDQMKFTVTRIEASPGEELTVVLKNVGSFPKEAMGHNWVLLTKGSDVNAYAAAAVGARNTDYLPGSLSSQVIAHTKMLGPKQSDTVKFTVPSEPGEYPFLCSFPAHAISGMKGVLVVR